MQGGAWRRSLWARLLAAPFALLIVGGLVIAGVSSRLLAAGADRSSHDTAAALAATASAMVRSTSHALATSHGALSIAMTPGQMARAATDRMRQDAGGPGERVRVAAIDPTSPDNRADPYETRLIAAFEADHSMKRTVDDVSTPAGDMAVVAYPVIVTSSGCLHCHSTPSAAPPGRVAAYGRSGGYGWRVGQVVATAVAYVPTSPARSAVGRVAGGTVACFMLLVAAALGLVGWNVRSRISLPARTMLDTSRAIRRGEWGGRFTSAGSDELAALASSFQDTTRWLRERVAEEEKLRAMFQQFVPASVAARTLGRDSARVIEGQQQTVTVMVINIRNFKLLMEHLPPQETVTTLNEFFSQVNGAIVEHNGLVSKYLGDTVLAFFGMPVQTETHPLDAVRASLAIPRALQDLYVRLDEEYGWQLGVGIGIATGDPIVGHFGSSEHYEYSILGDVVVEAQALEQISKGVPEEDTIVVSETTYRLIMSDVHVFDMGARRTTAGREIHAFAVQGLRKEARSGMAA